MIRADHALTSVHIGGACLLCLNPNDIIDTEVSIPYEGVLAICTRCVRDLALCAGIDVSRNAADWDAMIEEHAEAVEIAGSLLTVITEVSSTAATARRKHRNRIRQWRKRHEVDEGPEEADDV